MITDTCCCGARVEIRHTLVSSERDDHRWWLASHEMCRETSRIERTESHIETVEIHTMEREDPVATVTIEWHDGEQEELRVSTPPEQPMREGPPDRPSMTKRLCHCGEPGWGENGCCGVSGCNNVPA